MKILMINYEFPPLGGGGGKASYHIAKYLNSWGHEVHILTSKFRGYPEFEIIDCIKIHRVPVKRNSVDICTIFEMLTFVIGGVIYGLKLVKEIKPDIMHVFFGIPSGPVAWVFKRIFKIPYITSLRGSDVPRKELKRFDLLYKVLTPLIRLIWRDSSRVVSNSEGLKKIAQKIDSRVYIQVIPNGVELDRFGPVVGEDGQDRVKVLFVGRLIAVKNLELLINSAPEILGKSNKKVIFELVGEGVMREKLEVLARDLGVSDRVTFKKWVDYENIHIIYQNADIFILISLTEGMPNVVLEAMACGLPIVGTRIPGNEELIINGENGYLIPVDSKKELINALLTIINDDGLRKKMGIKSRKIADGYGWDVIAKQYEEIYHLPIEG